MSTLAELKDRIEKDIHRTDISADVSAAIVSAIRHYNRADLWFLEGSWVFTTSASLTTYTATSDLKTIDILKVNKSGSSYPINEISYRELEEKDDGRATGSPSYWNFYGDAIKFSPIPDATYTISVSYKRSIDAPSESGSNVWTNTGFDLIRYRAGWDVLQNRIWNAEQAKISKSNEGEAYLSLLTESIKKMSTGKLKRSEW